MTNWWLMGKKHANSQEIFLQCKIPCKFSCFISINFVTRTGKSNFWKEYTSTLTFEKKINSPLKGNKYYIFFHILKMQAINSVQFYRNHYLLLLAPGHPILVDALWLRGITFWQRFMFNYPKTDLGILCVSLVLG